MAQETAGPTTLRLGLGLGLGLARKSDYLSAVSLGAEGSQPSRYALLPNAVLHSLPGGHLSHISNYRVFAEVLMGFFGKEA